ncbi:MULTISPECIES: hypothetical protein [Pseudomonas]|uniref:hypothetical protein n=1 Tax=Pseudomonas TaxID=286 RepID=UPI000F014FA3|nr:MULTISPECIES: hypothetical protein [Pseudomonas]MBD8681234.1 hypothetical protein [Pseudomonas sp. CFBP 13719]
MSIIDGKTASDLLSNWLAYEKRNSHAMETVGRSPGGKSFRWNVGPSGWRLNLSESGSSHREISDGELDQVIQAIETRAFSISGYDLQMSLPISLYGQDQSTLKRRQRSVATQQEMAC